VHIRRPRVDYESHVVGLDRNEVGALLVAAGLSSPRDHALVPLFALNGLRVSEAVRVDIDNLDLERGHRTLTVLRKGGKTVTMPLAPSVARAIELAGHPSDRHSASCGPVRGPRGGRDRAHVGVRIARRSGRSSDIATAPGEARVIFASLASITRSGRFRGR
jgi:integrase/recombinase XerD